MLILTVSALWTGHKNCRSLDRASGARSQAAQESLSGCAENQTRSIALASVVLDELCAFEAEPIRNLASTYAVPEFSRNVKTPQGTAVSL